MSDERGDIFFFCPKIYLPCDAKRKSCRDPRWDLSRRRKFWSWEAAEILTRAVEDRRDREANVTRAHWSNTQMNKLNLHEWTEWKLCRTLHRNAAITYQCTSTLRKLYGRYVKMQCAWTVEMSTLRSFRMHRKNSVRE